MSGRFDNLTPPSVSPSVTTNELRDNLSQVVNRAAYGCAPVFITRRGRKIAAIISIEDLEFLEKMRQRRDEARGYTPPADQSKVGAALADQPRRKLFFG